AQTEVTARYSRLVVALHGAPFWLMYFGLGNAVNNRLVPIWFAGQRVAGAVVILSSAALMSWAVAHFSSWRMRAKLDAGHQLATGGPFRFLRNPIYMAMNLFALGTAIWVPTTLVWVGVVIMV